MLTYERGETDVVLPSPFNSSDSTANGLGLGARLGVQVYESGFIALDVYQSNKSLVLSLSVPIPL